MVLSLHPKVHLQKDARTGKPTLDNASGHLASLLAEYSPRSFRRLFQARAKSLPDSLQNVVVLRFGTARNAEQFLAGVRGDPDVLFAEPNRTYRILQQPNDPRFTEQWYLLDIEAPRAWSFTTGKADVLVGVIDTGVDYLHPDLQGRFWVNPLEDLNQNGQLDSTDLNGLDEDGNGYVDDVIGWDFVHAPEFPDQGDYLNPDPDPMDEFGSGHGTAVAGIISATQGNQEGISGVAPGVRVMILRAGTAAGFLQEDDVAEAILYAVDNGCRVINMSFGDVAYSLLLQQVIQYGLSRGVLFVAAAGNSGDAQLHFPAALDGVVAVGASAPGAALASFSSYGSKLDLVAPGQGILSTLLGGGYGELSGTSFAAPMVSAALALLASWRPDAHPNLLLSALLAGCVDLQEPGWDPFTGHGLLNLHRSLTSLESGLAQLISPATGSGTALDQVPIIGTAFGPAMTGYTLLWGTGQLPANLVPFASVSGRQVIADTLAMWDASSLPDTTYTLELRLQQRNGPSIVTRNVIELDRSPPRLVKLERTLLMRGPGNAVLFTVETDDPSETRIDWRRPGQGVPWGSSLSAYRSNTHYFLEDEQFLPPENEFTFWMTNAAGLSAQGDSLGQPFHISLPRAALSSWLLARETTFPVKGYLCPCHSDLDEDGNPEFLFSLGGENAQFGPLAILEWENGQLRERMRASLPAIPRDVGDIFLEGKPYLLAGYGATTFLLAPAAGLPFGYQVVWWDSSNFWGARLANLDGDPQLEMLAIQQGQWHVWEIQQNPYRVMDKALLANPTAGNNQYAVPYALITDLEGNGRVDILYRDLDNDLVRYEWRPPDQYHLRDTLRIPGYAVPHLLQALDVDGDGRKELLLASQKLPSRISESSFLARYWELTLWRFSADEPPRMKGRWRFHGVNPERGARAALAVGDLDGDGRPDAFFAQFNHLYWLQNTGNTLQVRAHIAGVNSPAILAGDLDQDGQAELWFSGMDDFQHWQYQQNPQRPPPPQNVQAVPLDTAAVLLSWESPLPVEQFRIYRAVPGDSLRLLDSTGQNQFLDTLVQKNILYWYRVTSVSNQFPLPESQLSTQVSARPNSPPRLVRQEVVADNQVRLYFSEPMHPQAFQPVHYLLVEQMVYPRVVVRERNREAVLLGFANSLAGQTATLRLQGLRDEQGTPLQPDSLQLEISFPPAQPSFYLVSARILNRTTILLEFSQPVDPEEAAQREHYRFDPPLEVEKAVVDSQNAHLVRLSVSRANRLGGLGQSYWISVSGLHSVQGTPLQKAFGNRVELVLSPNNLQNMVVYPNPYRAGQTAQPLRFARLPYGAEIYIYNASGQPVRGLKVDNFAGGVSWDLRNELGEPVGSGVYFFLVRYQNEKKNGKLLLIR